MAVVKGTLKIVNKKFQVVLPTKKGTAPFQISEAAKQFLDSDAEDGIEVDVERNARNVIVKVTIPGKEVAAPVITPPKGKGGSKRSFPDRSRSQSKSNLAVKDLPKASPKSLGSPFHNPYTFLKFPAKPPKRQQPTALTSDESLAANLYTGVIRVKVKTISPLLSCSPEIKATEHGHNSYEAMTIEDDVILPATGVRGFLRTLLTIVSGGTLSYINENTFLCQGRDLNLGPATERSKPGTPKSVFLAEVLNPGDYYRQGTVQVGETKLVSSKALEAANHGKRLDRRAGRKKYFVGLDHKGHPTRISTTESDETPWRLKLSGQPINWKGKREGVLLIRDTPIEIGPKLWAEYLGRHAGSDRPELRKGDLIWLEPADPNQAPNSITHEGQIRSLQWARWGRRGQPLTDNQVVPSYMMPDYLTNDGKVDCLTNMFGMVSPKKGKSPDFAGKVRPANLVFENAKATLQDATLAPLISPKPGCVAFYRRGKNGDTISTDDPYQGYKVYRTSKSDDKPWLFETQGVYEDDGRLKDPKQKVNSSVQLLPEGAAGSLVISFRSLSKTELALLIQSLELPWRLGGGKPLGLGLCTVESYELCDEFGQPFDLPDWQAEIEKLEIKDRISDWIASQDPVDRLRYPRAVDRNKNKNNRGGHAWFSRHARPRKGEDKTGKRMPGLEPFYIGGDLEKRCKTMEETFDPTLPMIAGQILGPFQSDDQSADQLYGYDLLNVDSRNDYKPNRNTYLKMKEFDESSDITGEEQSGGNQGKNREMREENKKSRRGEND